MTRKIAIDTAAAIKGARYPAPFDEPCRERLRRRLGDVAGLSHFGVNLTRLPPGTWSSQRHWHTSEDEFVYVLEGEVILVTDDGEEILCAGDCAGFKAGVADEHHLQNRSASDALVFEVGTRRPTEDATEYPDIDLAISRGSREFTHRDGTSYPNDAPRKPATER